MSDTRAITSALKNPRRGPFLLLLASIAGVFAAYVALTGGIDSRIGNIPLRSRSWERPAMLAALLAAAGLFSLRRAVLGLVLTLGSLLRAGMRPLAAHLPLIAACWAGLSALTYGTYAAGGADSYGYVSQAELMAHGRLTEPLPPIRAFTWPDVPYTLTPLGYRVGAARRTIAPSYPPGLPLLMAPLTAIHPRLGFLVLPVCAAAAVLLCFRLGQRLGAPLAGRIGALLLSVSPTFLYQAVQPMSDVPVTAFWLAAMVAAPGPAVWSAPLSGLLASIAVLIRPNLAPLALLVIAATAAGSGRLDVRRAIISIAALVPGLLALGAIQEVRYGSPFASGYGPITELFSVGNIGPNLERYPRWLTDTHSPFIWLWLLAPFSIVRAAREVRPFGWLCYAFAIAVVAAYLPYSYFRPEEWFYTRFLLPAIPFFLVLGTSAVVDIVGRLSPRATRAIAACLALAVASFFAITSVRLGAFELRQVERKYPAVGAFVRERLPPSAFLLAMQHSGSIRYYSRRYTLRWDLLDRASLGRAITALRAAGYTPFAVLDHDEDIEFRKRFGVASADALELMMPVGHLGDTQIYAFR